MLPKRMDMDHLRRRPSATRFPFSAPPACRQPLHGEIRRLPLGCGPYTARMSPHSEDWFGDERDHWWNQDFLALMARRWRLDRVKRVLDVGCGQGHWGRALLPHLPRASLTGIDPEPEWVTRAGELARGLPAT